MKKASKRIHKKEDITKAVCQRYHCLKRIKERLKISFNEENYEQIVSCIKNHKDHPIYKLKYITNQSIRLSVYELIIENMEPINVIYDKSRQTIVTVLFPIDGIEIYHYYDIFGNKVQIKSELGYNKHWKFLNDSLIIPEEDLVKENDIWRVVSEGILFDKKYIGSKM